MSGKRAKYLRKKAKISKKAAASAIGLCLCTVPVSAQKAGDFLLSVYPHYTMPISNLSLSSLGNGFGGGLKLTYRPLPYLDLYVQGDYKYLSFNTNEDINGFSLVNGGIGAGAHIPFTDRLSMNINADVGAYNADTKVNKIQGLNLGASLTFSYKINSKVAADVNAGGVHFVTGTSKFLTGAEVAPGITLNLTKAFTNSAKLKMEQKSLDPVFPVLYSWYENNSFGNVEITNEEDATITDVKVSFFQPQYMSHPKECGTIEKLGKGQSFGIELKAFFNEQMLELLEKTDTQSTIIVEYKYLGQKREKAFAMVVPVYGRNNMSWADDRCASVFVSSKDPAAMWFAKYITSVVRDNVRSGVALNVQYAMGIFEALDQFGLNYVIDPTSAFADNVGTASIDFLQFPYQTLMYRGGDCDDLSILVCSLFEAIGIKTAFITIPGHIFMAFDSGLTVAEAKAQFGNLDELIIDGDSVWVPLEITLTDEGFNKAWRVGAREWNTAAKSGNAAMFKMQDSWTIYKPVNVPGATSRFTLPDEKLVGRLFSHCVDDFILKQITPQIEYYQAKLKTDPSAETYNDFGVLYARYGLFSKAESQFRAARRLEYMPAILNTANLYYSMRDFVRAQKWYEQVLENDSTNTLAMLGIARCAYETGEYDVCDKYYGQVFDSDVALAMEYSYLGAFENTQGRSFTLADRLSNTIWVDSGFEVKDFNIAKTGYEENKEKTPLVNSDFMDPLVAIVPAETNLQEENEENSLEGGDGDDGNDDEIEFEEPLKQERKYKGILSQLEFDIISSNELAMITEQSETPLLDLPLIPEFTLDEVQIPEETKRTAKTDKLIIADDSFNQNEEEITLPAEKTLPNIQIAAAENQPVENQTAENQTLESDALENQMLPAENLQIAVLDAQDTTSEIETTQNDVQLPVDDIQLPSLDTQIALAEPVIENREVPRFTVQPSQTWAPEEAYTAQIIPGMRSFEEEMGEYQNEKAFLYQDEFAFAVNPEEDTDDVIKTETTTVAMSESLEANPFSSFLSEEDAKVVEEITNFSIKPASQTAKLEVQEPENNKTSEENPQLSEEKIIENKHSVEFAQTAKANGGNNGTTQSEITVTQTVTGSEVPATNITQTVTSAVTPVESEKVVVKNDVKPVVSKKTASKQKEKSVNVKENAVVAKTDDSVVTQTVTGSEVPATNVTQTVTSDAKSAASVTQTVTGSEAPVTNVTQTVTAPSSSETAEISEAAPRKSGLLAKILGGSIGGIAVATGAAVVIKNAKKSKKEDKNSEEGNK